MNANEIRKRFLEFFASRGHRVVKSSSLIPANDPTLLFANAGMNQFKDVFLGLEKRDYTRACSVQKCVRAGGKHNDLEQVGRTRRHHTFFEMLGNFSFGDYFKAEAIPWAWELVTKDFGLPADRLYSTVFREDDEAEQIWAKLVPRDRIFRFDEKDNFWQMGETGPCGPCSEIHYDMGPEASDLGHKDCKFPCPQDCGRYVEIWNLVFMQFNREVGAIHESPLLTPLPRPSIDTGAGLERLSAVLQGKVSNFDTDLFKPLIDEAAGLATVEYGANHDADVSLRIIADHARAATFLISDGVLPSNEGRGYVLRRILRRALYHGGTLGLKEPFLYKMSAHVAEIMKESYPEVLAGEHRIAKAIKIEEERFASSLKYGGEKLEEYIQAVRINPQNLPQLTLPGDWAFKLYDTYGLPLDLIIDFCRDQGFHVDQSGFDRALANQRERARASWKGAEKKIVLPVYKQLAEERKTEFEGYRETTSSDCKILALLKNSEAVKDAKPGENVEIVLDRTPFYAEAGGQVGDNGHLDAPGGTEVLAHVHDAYAPVSGLIAHRAMAREALHVGDVVTAVVDAERRNAIRRNHTGTHLLHAALHEVVGTHAKQAGSLVAPDRLRFDFTHYAALSEQDVLDIEDLVNQHVLANEEVHTEVTELEKAVESGAMALFGEKYGDRVRVVSIADGSFSKELCGGTHVRRTGDIGLFKIVSESSVSAGTRRIEALTGTGVLENLRKASETLAQLSNTLRAKPDELLEAAEKLEETEKKLRKQLEAQQQKSAVSSADKFVSQAQKVKGVFVISQRVDPMSRDAMRQVVDRCRAQIKSGVIVLGSVSDGKVALVAAVTKDLTDRLDAGKIVKQAAAIVSGSGGGRKDLAEAGGTEADKLDESLRAVPGIIEKML
jgi:alanyl-tRNA synthetase